MHSGGAGAGVDGPRGPGQRSDGRGAAHLTGRSRWPPGGGVCTCPVISRNCFAGGGWSDWCSPPRGRWPSARALWPSAAVRRPSVKSSART
eukprot:6574295-Pyramimonas_sp.AAC.1